MITQAQADEIKRLRTAERDAMYSYGRGRMQSDDGHDERRETAVRAISELDAFIYSLTEPEPAETEPIDKPVMLDGETWVRLPSCVERWPECESFGYDPRCCRFPKSCSCLVPASEVPDA